MTKPPLVLQGIDKGAVRDVAESLGVPHLWALETSSRDRERVMNQMAAMTPYEFFDRWLNWIGIVNYTMRICEVYETIRGQSTLISVQKGTVREEHLADWKPNLKPQP